MTPTPGEGVIIAVVLYDESSCLLWLWDGIGTMFDNVPVRLALHLLVFLLPVLGRVLPNDVHLL
jgi:hypothetical protein